jgi:HPr kinase/phosphorylase
MNNGKDFSLTVLDFFNKWKKDLKLNWKTKRTGKEKKIFPDFPYKINHAIYVLGKDEYDQYQSSSGRKKQAYLKRVFSRETACIIGSRGVAFFSEFVKIAEEKNVVLFTTSLSERDCHKRIKELLSGILPNQIILSGGLLEIFGLGIIIIGDSGVGKSESALELISHGHKFVSDDVTLFYFNENGFLCGSAPETSRNYMEIRGLGIINIKEIFSEHIIKERAKVDLVIQLKRWEEGKQYDRLGLKFPKKYEILGKKIPQIVIPVAPGRNIALLIEVACKVHVLRKKGINASLDMISRVDHLLWNQKINEKKSER